MKKLIGAALAVAVLVAAFVAYRAGMFGGEAPSAGTPAEAGGRARPGSGTAGISGGNVGAAGGAVTTATSVPGETPDARGAVAAGGTGPATGTAGAISGTTATGVDIATLARDGNIALLDFGAHIESVSDEHNRHRFGASYLLADDPNLYWCVHAKDSPKDVVLSFFAHQPVLIQSVVILPGHKGDDKDAWLKDVEIWTSTESPSSGFAKVASATMRQELVEQTIPIEPAEARYVKLRVVSNYGSQTWTVAHKLKIIEGRRAGYTPLLARNPDLAAVAAGSPLPGADSPQAAAVPSPGVATPSDGCAPVSAAATIPSPRRPESRNVLVVAADSGEESPRNEARFYPPTQFRATDTKPGVDHSIYGRLRSTALEPVAARPALLLPAFDYDTVVLAQVCDVATDVPASFKKALPAWVGQGHKLIIQDSDECGGTPGPDYSFLPFSFATSNPGAQGKSGPTLFFVEENHLVNNKPGDPAFLDVESWLASKNGSYNEIGDSNTIYKYDAHWCGQLFGTNVQKVNGFMLAYAHYGRGLIIYDGFDEDQRSGVAYRQLVTRELALGFDPDGLPCSARLGDFVITTEQRLKVQPLVPGRTYTYPLTLYSNQGYKGAVNLSLAPTPADPGLQFHFEPASVPLEEISTTTLTVTAAASASPQPHVLTVKGTDASGKTNTLCLQLTERTTGGIQVLSDLRRDRKPTKNLEIILDSSGSMKAALGKKTRWRTALDVLEQVLQKLPDDFNVGLRIYGHRESSLSPKTCTDSELVVPIGKLHRGRLLSAARGVQPRGETPLVYSVLQTPEDLKAVGGGAVILITDGEESCKGDVKAAAQAVRQSGLDVTVNIVGFTLTGKQTQAQLTTLAEGTGGHYYVAQSGEALARALLIAAVEKFPYVIYDAAGKAVAKGEAGGAPEELPAGEYRVAITSGDQTLTEAVTVATGGDVRLRVQLKGDKFVVQR